MHEVVERWRGIAILQTDPDAYRRTMRRAAELATGEPSPDDEPLEVSEHGYDDVVSIAGGTNVWQESGRPVDVRPS